MANMTFKANLLPNSNLSYNLGSSDQKWNVYGDLTGNAATATKLATARTISLTGSVTGSGTFDGSGNLSITTIKNHTHPVNEITWAGGQNLTPTATANGQEWSIDLNPGDYTGTYWHIWSTPKSATILGCYPDDRHVTMPGNLTATSTTTGTLRVTGGAGFTGTVYAGSFNGPLTGNASTATALTSNAGSSTQPIYFSGGKPVQCSTTLGISISGTAANATKFANLDLDQFVHGSWHGTEPLSNCNSVTRTGFYSNSELPNKPTGTSNWGSLININLHNNPTYHRQLYFECYANNNIYTRYCDDGTWGKWAELVRWEDSANLSNCNAVNCTGFFTRGDFSNRPSAVSNWGSLMNIRLYYSNNLYHRQLFFDCYSSDKIWTRSADNGNWTSWKQVWVQGNAVTGAVWNDYAEYRESETIEPGYIMCEKGDGSLYKSTKRCQEFAGVSSDTWGFAQGETEKAKTPIAVSGRVLVYVKDKVKVNDYICSGPEGIGLKMRWWEKILYPHRVVGIVSEIPTYEKWGGGEGADRDPVDVNGRIWIKCCN